MQRPGIGRCSSVPLSRASGMQPGGINSAAKLRLSYIVYFLHLNRSASRTARLVSTSHVYTHYGLRVTHRMRFMCKQHKGQTIRCFLIIIRSNESSMTYERPSETLMFSQSFLQSYEAHNWQWEISGVSDGNVRSLECLQCRCVCVGFKCQLCQGSHSFLHWKRRQE